MAESYSRNAIIDALYKASAQLSSRKEEINRLNVFPVPDGDTGTNMSLTIESVVKGVRALPADSSFADLKKTITQNALMGARGNSGVITSQIMRGICEGIPGPELNTQALDACLSRATDVAFQAVRKPVEGTILTVLRDASKAAHTANKKKMSIDDAMAFVADEAYASVKRTPDLLPVLKENGVVDAGGFGLAIFFDAFSSALSGREEQLASSTSGEDYQPKVEIEHIHDWEGSAYRYCNEFLVYSETLVPADALDFLQTMGDCELCVGATPRFKVHVHSNHPDQVLKYFLDRGQIFEVFIHNMDMQSEERNEKLVHEHEDESPAHQQPPKPLGVVAVAAGEGNAEILRSLGVDVVVQGGQTMNPSTKDLFDAASSINADAIIILPDNSNIVMAAQSAAQLMEKPCAVVPTKSVPQAFSAMFSFVADASLEDNVEAMSEAIRGVKTGEITTAIKDSRDAHGNPIVTGDVIGIADGSIEVVSDDVDKAALELLSAMHADTYDTLTILAGEGYTDDRLQALVSQIEVAFPDVDVDPQRGDQPLYPLVMSVE